MGSLETLREFLGWCTLINAGLLLVSSLAMMAFRGPISRIHGKLFGLGEGDISRAFYNFLAYYKIAFFMLNAVPYLALVIMTSGGGAPR